MSDSFEMRPIARIRGDFGSKFGVPRQSGLVDALEAAVVFEEPYRNPDARGWRILPHLADLGLSPVPAAGMVPTVRPPRLGGNQRVGVFASRSPFRPNPIGLSSVRLDHIAYTDALGPVLHVRGADLVDGTPILDIKPYLPYGTATRRPPAALPASRRVPRWRWKSHPPCWTNCLRTGGRPSGCVGLGSPVPGISRTRTGCTASSSPGRR